ncbi:MAG: Fic/DOC family N-terminal domain-containing protein [Nitriliruptoraceae bacterium]
MDPAKFVDKTFGEIRRVPGAHGHDHYVPAPIPRELDLSRETTRALSAADRALGRLAGAGRLLANPHLLVQPYLTAEALASSRIEGTQASLSEVFEAATDDEDSSNVDVREVQNHVAAFQLGMQLLDELPLSLRLLRQVHARLLQHVRGEEKNPGEFRTSQNWIGAPGRPLPEATFVPPRHEPEMIEALTDWEQFLHDREGDLPPLVACALLHYQFETIHPFLDGNGRLGRVVAILYLMNIGELPQPLLYLSPWFERDRDTYYERLQAVRERGEMQQWLTYFLDGVARQAQDAVARAELLTDLQGRYRAALADDRSRAAHVIDLMFANPYVTTARVARHLGVTPAGALNLIRRLEGRGWLREARVAGQGGRITWVASEVMDTLQGAVTNT